MPRAGLGQAFDRCGDVAGDGRFGNFALIGIYDNRRPDVEQGLVVFVETFDKAAAPILPLGARASYERDPKELGDQQGD